MKHSGLHEILGLILFSIFILVFVGGLIKEVLLYFTIRKNGIDATGKICNYSNENDHEGILFYTPVIEYSDLNGRKYVKKLFDLNTLRKPTLNVIIPLKYMPENPEKVIVNNTKTVILQFFKVALAFAGLGISLYFILAMFNIIESI